MRHSVRAIVLCAVLMVAATLATAADLSVGYIDSSRIFVEYKEAQDAQQRFDRLVQGWRDEAAEKEKTVAQLRAEVRDQGPILSALKRQEKETALQRAVTEYENFIQEIWGPTGRAAQENDRATGEIVQQIRAAVEKIASQKGLTLVFDSTSGMLVYADRSLDITADVLTELAARTAGTSR
ncbi:MAG: OmpH family outer membrane protein [Candidatus Eisenbacteria bacterium]